MTNYVQMDAEYVQGVHGVQGAFYPTLHSYRQRRSLLCAILCGVCRHYVRGRARAIIFLKHIRYTYKTLPHDTPPAHPAHPAQPLMFVVCSCAGYFLHLTHPALYLFFIKKMNKLICGEENIKAFRAEFKAVAPDFYSLAKELYTAGLISGLRGCTLDFFTLENEVVVRQPEIIKSQRYCEECNYWRRDQIGDGTGVGECRAKMRPELLKWPGREACNKFEAAS